MVSPIVPLAFALHSNRGAYAVLLGSGVSAAAGIPTGRQVVEDLITKIARLEGESVGEHAGGWYRDRFGEEPDYGKLLDTLARSPTERSLLLRGYFEPTDRERAQGVKVPGAAHRALAQLAASGHLRLFLTTNFDRLLEQALEDAGVIPTVISSADSIDGAAPLAHSGCTVVKLNGDCRDTRIKNTAAELARYDASVDALLDRVLDEHGLIVCGWSADWDTALAAAFERCESRRYTTYWAQVGAQGEQATRLIALRQAEVLPIEDADAFFTELAAKATALDEDAQPEPAVREGAKPDHNLPAQLTGDVEQAPTEPAASSTAAAAPPARRSASATSVQFCTTPDDVRIAYAIAATGAPFVKVANWLTHLEFDLESPIWRHLITDLAPDRQFIRYDARGSGLSDWDVGELSLDGWVRDLEALIEELGLDRFPLLGISQGGAIAIEYTLRNPGRVSHLVLQGGFARGRRLRGGEQQSSATTLELLAKQGWGRPESAFARMFSDRMIPGGTPEQQSWLTDLQRVSTNAESALRFMQTNSTIDIVDKLPHVDVPTLVLHSRDDEQVPFEEGRLMAAGIPDARLVPLDGRNHLVLEGEPAWPIYRNEVQAFLATGPA